MRSRPRTGLLVANLGSPDAPEPGAVRRYLAEFLSDPRVLDMPALGRWLLLNCIILPLRPAKSAAAWKQIWSEDGSPLVAHGRTLAAELARRLPDFPVELGMRYGSPSLASALERLRDAGCERIVLFPLFPQYASSSTGSMVEAVYREAARFVDVPHLAVVPPFFEHPAFVEAWERVGRGALAGDEDHVLFSFHSLPVSHLRKGDPTGARCLQRPDCCDVVEDENRCCYRAHSFATARAVAGALGLAEGGWSVSFQSRLTRDPWIQPATEARIEELARSGVRKLAVFSPSFVADCLETIEELGIRGKELFLGAGGERFTLVPSLNAEPAWLDAAERLVGEALGGSATPR
jgi:ferrochelatase